MYKGIIGNLKGGELLQLKQLNNPGIFNLDIFVKILHNLTITTFNLIFHCIFFKYYQYFIF